MVIILYGCVIIFVQNAQFDQFPDALMRQIRVDSPGAETKKRRDLVHVSGLSALQDQGYGRSLFRADQVLLHTGDRQQGRDGHVVLVHAAV